MIPAEDLGLPGTGTALRPFPFRVEFPMQEGFAFATDVITHADGSEQRVAVRDPARPRQLLRGRVHAFERDEVAHLQALLYGWNLFTYGVPLWFHAMRLSAAVAATDTALPVVATAGRDLEDRLIAEADVPVLLWAAHDDWEPAILAAVASDTLTLRDGLTRDWPARTLVLPLQVMLAADVIDLERPARAIGAVEVEFVQGSVPVSPNMPCDDAAEPLARALMVRPTPGGSVVFTTGSDYGNDHANAAGLFPQAADSPHDLFGFSVTAAVGASYSIGSGLNPTSKGRTTGFSKCTAKAPASFATEMLGVGLGAEVGVDCDLSVHYPVGGASFPAGLTEDGPHVVGGAFTGAGYFPAPSAATARSWVVAVATLRGGIGHATSGSSGDVVSSYGRYDAGEPGGIKYYALSTEVQFNGFYVRLKHGYCVRLTNIAAYKGVKIVTEEVLYSSPGVESGLFGAPAVTTHDFTSGDYADALTPGGAYAIALAGGTTLFGQSHVANDAMELYRVTVSLIDMADVDHLQFIDIFSTMLVEAEKGT